MIVKGDRLMVSIACTGRRALKLSGFDHGGVQNGRHLVAGLFVAAGWAAAFETLG